MLSEPRDWLPHSREIDAFRRRGFPTIYPPRTTTPLFSSTIITTLTKLYRLVNPAHTGLHYKYVQDISILIGGFNQTDFIIS